MTDLEPALPEWRAGGDYRDIAYETAEGIAKIAICRPEVRNAFRPQTLAELGAAFTEARDDPDVGVVVLTGQGELAFCSGGDQRIRGEDGYLGDDDVARRGIGRLNVLDLQVQIRRLPKPVVAMVAGYAIGGGHVLHLVCDLTIAAENASFGQTGPRVGSFDAGYGAGLLARTIGAKRAKEIWFLCRQYDAERAYEMGLVNAVVPLARLEAETVAWCREMLALSPRFAEMWAAHEVEARGPMLKRVHHPQAGPLEFECQVLHIAETGQRLIAYCAAPGSATEAAFRQLAVRAAQPA